jgi:WD40 repeat protein
MYPVANGKYRILVAADSFNLTNVFGYTAAVMSYLFDPVANTLVLQGSQLVNQYIQGFDVSPDGKTFAVITDDVALNYPSILQVPHLPFDNSNLRRTLGNGMAYRHHTLGKNIVYEEEHLRRNIQAGVPNVDDELRFYNLDETTGALTFMDSQNMNSYGITVRFSPDNKLFAAVVAPNVVSAYVPTIANTSNTVYSFSPTTVLLYKVTGSNLRIKGFSGGSPLSFGLAFSNDSKRLAVAGQPTPTFEDTQLYVIKNSNDTDNE